MNNVYSADFYLVWKGGKSLILNLQPCPQQGN